MTLPSSGAISLSQVNTELSLSSTATISLNDSAVRNLFGKASGAIAMSDGYGKSAGAPTNSPGSSYSFSDSIFYDGSTIPSAYLSYTSNGTWNAVGVYSGSSGSGNWYSPTTTSIGNSYWVRFTRTATVGAGSSTATTGWLQVSSTRQISVTKSNANSGTYSATYTIDLATDSGGSTIVKTFTGVILTATIS